MEASGPDIHAIFPQKTQTIKNVALARTATKDEIVNIVQRQLRIDPIHPDFIERAREFEDESKPRIGQKSH
jgi:hypothetical protein